VSNRAKIIRILKKVGTVFPLSSIIYELHKIQTTAILPINKGTTLFIKINIFIQIMFIIINI
jgi:hypothetical protein